MGKQGYREKWIHGKLFLFCTQCLEHKPPVEFDYATYVNIKGKRQHRSACTECTSKQNKRYRLKKLNYEK